MLKCAIDMPGLAPGVERIMRAVAKANPVTGTPITAHTAPQAQTGLIVQQVLTEEGVNLESVVIGHCGDTQDLDYLMKLADKGSILGMDRFWVDFAISMPERVATIAAMIERGYVSQLTLGHDCCASSDFFPEIEHYHQAMPNHHYLHIHQHVIPALLEAGVSQGDLNAILSPTAPLSKERRSGSRTAEPRGIAYKKEPPTDRQEAPSSSDRRSLPAWGRTP